MPPCENWLEHGIRHNRQKETGMTFDFEDVRGMILDIKELAKGGKYYASYAMKDDAHGDFFFAILNVITKDTEVILELFDRIELLPEINQIKILR